MSKTWNDLIFLRIYFIAQKAALSEKLKFCIFTLENAESIGENHEYALFI